MKNLLIFTLFLFLLPHYTQSQTDDELNSIYSLVDDFINLNDYHSALSKVNEAQASYPGNDKILALKVEVLMLLEELKEAWKIANQSIDEHPNSGALLASRGKLQILYKGKYRNAIEDFTEALNLISGDGDKRTENKIYVNRGAAYQKDLQPDLALEDYTKAIELNPNNPNVYQYRGFLYYQQKDYREAIADFDRVVSIDENNHYAFYNRGMCYFKLKEEDNACDDFHKSCELGNRNACKMVISNCVKINR